MDADSDSQVPDETRPIKRARLEAPLAVTEDFQEELDDEDGWNDIYAPDTEEADGIATVNGADEIARSQAMVAEHPEGVDTLGTKSDLLEMASQPNEMNQSASNHIDDHLMSAVASAEDGIPVEAMDTGDELVLQQETRTMTDAATAQVLEETSKVEGHLVVNSPDQMKKETPKVTIEEEQESGTVAALGQEEMAKKAVNNTAPTERQEQEHSIGGSAIEKGSKPPPDPEFLAAAAAQKGNTDAEWQFDSSDADSSSDSDSDSSSDESSSDDSGSDGGYELLDAATAAKILMSGDADDDDGERGKNKSGGDFQPRTTNEIKEVVVPKPDVVVTEEMKITLLGTVDRVVQNMILIKAATPGEFQVVESGSVLCKESREVIGAVAETLGRVQQPMYSVAFTNEAELKQAGVDVGTSLFYVEDHSTFVFTQPLRNLKGTDASNIHDEEVGEDEVEFSDDEKEAEYKRMKKLAKRGGRGGLSRTAFNARSYDSGRPGSSSGAGNFISRNDAPRQQYGGGMSYDEEDGQDEFYSPLKRPENLSQLMATGGQSQPQPMHDRGRGRGRGDFRGRGRGNRGRGRGGMEHHTERTGRERGHHMQSNVPRESGNNFSDRQNRTSNGQEHHPLPSKPSGSILPLAPPNHLGPTHHGQVQAPENYQFNGYTFQYGNPAPPPITPTPAQSNQSLNFYPPQLATGQIPPGAYVNPEFFQSHQQQQQQQPQHPQWSQNQWQAQQTPYPSWPGQFAAQQQQQQQQHRQSDGTPQQNNLADILRQFQGRQQ